MYGTLHGGAVAAVAELVSVACVKSVVDRDLFLGELSTCYLSAALVNVSFSIEFCESCCTLLFMLFVFFSDRLNWKLVDS